jgi:AraC family ethanolamine operon transcriptional activator
VSVAASNPKRASRLVEGFQRRLFFILKEILRSSTGRWPDPIPPRNRRLLEKAAAIVETQGDSPIGLTELCAEAQVSERTLIHLFKRELGMTPKAYLKGHRLFRVHRELWRAAPAKTHVADVANSWGFWHMGQFAADYRKLFGELPSETLKRSS